MTVTQCPCGIARVDCEYHRPERVTLKGETWGVSVGMLIHIPVPGGSEMVAEVTHVDADGTVHAVVRKAVVHSVVVRGSVRV